MTKGNPDIDEIYTIFAGKFRRYHGESWLKRAVDLPTNLQNLRDLVFIAIGFVQGLRLLRKIKPDVILLKGGYVGMPVGLAAALLKKPFVTHDSDALPGLANRLVGRWAKWHATGMPPEYYKYRPQSVRHIGVLVVKDYQPVTPAMQKQYKIDLNIQPSMKVLLVTGGSNGARILNQAMIRLTPELLERFQDLTIIHQVGKGNSGIYGEYRHSRLMVLEFLEGMHRYTGAADAVLTRAGANTLAELGVQGKACVVVPNPLLTGGHQLKNGQYLVEQQAAIVVDEQAVSDDVEVLKPPLEELLLNVKRRQELGLKLQAITISDAAARLASLLLETATH